MTNLTSTDLILPCFNRVLVQHIERESDSSIVLPDNVPSPLPWARVLAIGFDVKNFTVGDEVLLIPNCNILGIDDQRKIGIIHDSSIIAKKNPVVLSDH